MVKDYLNRLESNETKTQTKPNSDSAKTDKTS